MSAFYSGLSDHTGEQTHECADASISWDPLNHSSCIECALFNPEEIDTRSRCCAHRPWTRRGSRHLKDGLSGSGLVTQSICSISSPGAQRAQLHARFVDLCFPQDEVFKSPDVTTFAFLLRCLPTENQTISTALDALYITQVGTAFGDEALLHEGDRYYGQAVQYLQRDLSMIKNQCDDAILAAVHIVCFCERFESISGNCSSSKVLTEMVERLLKNRGTASVKSEFQLLQLKDYWRYAVAYGLVWRKPLGPTQPRWLRLAKRASGEWTALTSLILRLPRLLDSTDHFLRAEDKPLIANLRLISKLNALESEMKTWMTTRNQKLDEPPYRKIAAGPKHNWVFPEKFEFLDSTVAMAYVAFWTSLLVLQRAVKDLEENLPGSTDHVLISHARHEDLVPIITATADACCMALIAICSPENGTYGYMNVDHTLWLVYQWYEVFGDPAKQEWCRQMAEDIKTQGFRAPRLDYHPGR